MSACGHSSQDTYHYILHCPVRTLCVARYLATLRLWSWLWGVARILGLHGFPPCPNPSERVWQQQQQQQQPTSYPS